MQNLKNNFFYEEVSRKIIEIAILCRDIINRCDAEHDENYGYYKTCGSILNKTTTGQSLSIREACNKIIHAKQINFDNDSPIIYLYGRKHDASWKVEIFMMEFIAGCSCLAGTKTFLDYMEQENNSKKKETTK